MIASGLQIATGLIARHRIKRQEQAELLSYTPGSGFSNDPQLLPGQIFGITETHSKNMGSQTAVVSTGPCWILRVDANNKSGVAWLLVAYMLFQNQSELDEKIS